jgi:phosphoglucosamine mutase
MSNLGWREALGDLKIPFVRTAVGDRYILEYMAGKGWELGGEASGHILCRDKTRQVMGLLRPYKVLQQMMVSGKTLEELAEGMDIYPPSDDQCRD